MFHSRIKCRTPKFSNFDFQVSRIPVGVVGSDPLGCDIRESRNIVWQCHRDWGTFSSFSAAFSRLMSDWSRGRRGPEEMGKQHTFLEFLELFVDFVWDFFDNFFGSIPENNSMNQRVLMLPKNYMYMFFRNKLSWNSQKWLIVMEFRC